MQQTFASAMGMGFKRLNNKVFDFGSNLTSTGSGILVKSTFVEVVRFLENSLEIKNIYFKGMHSMLACFVVTLFCLPYDIKLP